MKTPWQERSIQAVLFDFEGTLATFTRPADELSREGAFRLSVVLRSNNLDLPEDFELQWLKAVEFAAKKSEQEKEEHTADDTLAFLVQFYGYTALDRRLVRLAVDAYFEPTLAAVALVPGARDALHALKEAEFFIGIVANHHCDRALQRMVRQLGVRSFADVVLTSQTVEDRKPKPKLYEMALAHWDVPPYAAIAVGDRLDEDVAPAQELGLRGVLFSHGEPSDHASRTAKITPDATLHAWNELAPLIARWQNEDATSADDFWLGNVPSAPPPLPSDFDPDLLPPDFVPLAQKSPDGPELDAETLAALLFGEDEE